MLRLGAAPGRAFIAIRDSEISAQSMGVNLARFKTLSFALSAGITGLAGALYAHQIRFISPEQFTISMSIELLVLVFIGGISQKDIGSIRTVILQLRAALPDLEILLATGAFGTADPRVPEELAKAAHSGAGHFR